MLIAQLKATKEDEENTYIAAIVYEWNAPMEIYDAQYEKDSRNGHFDFKLGQSNSEENKTLVVACKLKIDEDNWTKWFFFLKKERKKLTKFKKIEDKKNQDCKRMIQ